MNCEAETKVRDIIAQVSALLDEEKLHRRIDEPILCILESFDGRIEKPFAVRAFHQVIGSFVKVIYRDGLPIKQDLSEEQAQAEAIHILQGYQGQVARGYGAALYDAAQTDHNGIQLVLDQMAEYVRLHERDQYLQWVLATCLDHTDWPMKCRLVEYLIRELKPYLSESILLCHPSLLADQWPHLLRTYIRFQEFDPPLHLGS